MTIPLKLGYRPPLREGKMPVEVVVADGAVTVPKPNAAWNSWA
jgi:hypothetical protein